MRPDDARLTSLAIGIHDLPTAGPGKWIASFLAAFGIAAGLFLASVERKRPGKPRDRDVRRARGALLEELLGLERAHTTGQVGPRTYERARRELLEALARTLVETA